MFGGCFGAGDSSTVCFWVRLITKLGLVDDDDATGTGCDLGQHLCMCVHQWLVLQMGLDDFEYVRDPWIHLYT